MYMYVYLLLQRNLPLYNLPVITADGTDDEVPVILQEAEISVQSNADCAELMPTQENPRINDGHVCVYDERDVSPEEKRNVCSVRHSVVVNSTRHV